MKVEVVAWIGAGHQQWMMAQLPHTSEISAAQCEAPVERNKNCTMGSSHSSETNTVRASGNALTSSGNANATSIRKTKSTEDSKLLSAHYC